MTLNEAPPAVASAAPFTLGVEPKTAAGASERVDLAAYRWTPAPATAAADKPPLVIVHGFAEHARRHSELATAAAAAGHRVYALDLPGHGESPGPRAIVRGYRVPVAAAGSLVELATTETGGRRPVLLGHSMGGAIALALALEHPQSLAGLILSSPYLVDAVSYPGWIHRLLSLVAKVAPGLPVTRVAPRLISRDSAEVARYQNDPLVITSGVPAISANTLTRMGAELLQRAPGLEVRSLVLHGEDDGIAGITGSRSLQAATADGMIELITLPGGQHELFHDASSSGVPELVVQEVLDYLGDPSRATPS